MIKYFKILTVALLLISCSSDDDDDISNEDFVSLDINKNFLLGEKWFLNDFVSEVPIDLNNDGNESTDLLSQVVDCDLDNYYQFEQNQENLVVINDGENICDDFSDRFGGGQVYPFTVREDSVLMSTSPAQILGGFTDTEILLDVEFLISKDSSSKIFNSTIRTVIDGNVIFAEYSLIAFSNNRP